MTWDDYRAEVTRDALEALEDVCDFDADGKVTDCDISCIDVRAQTISTSDTHDELWADSGVTGNSDGSYTMDRAKAAENVAGIMFTDEMGEMLDEWGMSWDKLAEGPEFLDASARCWVLGQVCDDVAETFAEAHGLEVVD